MAPSRLDPPCVQERASKTVAACSDLSVVPSERASKRTRQLWWLHGHPHSKRYSNPNLVSLAALVRHDGAVYNSQEAFLYPISKEATTPYESMTWAEFDAITECLALTYARKLRDELHQANHLRKQPTIALLGAGITIEYFCTQLALQKLGVRVLLLAESNAPYALHHLLEVCEALAVITDSKNSRTDTNEIRKLDMIEQLPQKPTTRAVEVDAVKYQDFGDIWERHSFVLHSSGSTGVPKPIIHTNRSMMLIARMYRLFQEFDVINWFLLFPLYHVAGISIALSNLPNGQILSFPPLLWPPSSSAIFSALGTLDSMGYPVDCIHCAPTLIENMYEYITENGGDFTPLTSLKLLQPGGAALSETIVKALTHNGVNVKTTYGSTEIGPPFRSIPHTRDNPRCYSFRNLYPNNPLLKMEEVANGVYECVVYKGFELAANLWEKSDEPYRTNDLFIQDPPGSGFYILQGRRDDILVHSNGENTSAGALQLDIQSSSKLIHKAVALGHSKPCVGLLIEVNSDYDPVCKTTRDSIWRAVQRVNTQYPSHSQVTRSMIHFLQKGDTLPITPKGNVRRKEAERVYAAEIESLFSSNSQSTPRLNEPIAEYIRSTLSALSNTSRNEISDWTTLYDLGVDSRLALSLRTSISSFLQRPISIGAIFENPSIEKLVDYLNSTSTTNNVNVYTGLTGKKNCTAGTTKKIISRLEAEIRSWPTKISMPKPRREKEIIFLTGVSGSLGAALLEVLSASSRVEKIYAAVRGPNHIARLQRTLKKRGLSPLVLKERNIEVVNFSMQDPLLGLDIEKYIEIARNVTIVVANAWKMDFNLGVEEFENDCLRNLMSLLRLAHGSLNHATMAFTSSVSTCMGPGASLSISERPIGDNPLLALGTGYAQSKYIAERITQSAAKNLNVDISLLRVGQMCGSTQTGHWNPSEMFPIMFATILHPSMRCVPSFKGKSVDWIPVDVAASSITDILLQREAGDDNYSVHNIVNPHSITWNSLISLLQSTAQDQSQQIQIVTMKDWVARLSSLADQGVSPDDVPGLKLLQMFESMAAEGEGKEGKERVFETEKTAALSRALAGCEAFKQEWLVRNMEVWREDGLLKEE